jgi:hypothetical protein
MEKVIKVLKDCKYNQKLSDKNYFYKGKDIVKFNNRGIYFKTNAMSMMIYCKHDELSPEFFRHILFELFMN